MERYLYAEQRSCCLSCGMDAPKSSTMLDLLRVAKSSGALRYTKDCLSWGATLDTAKSSGVDNAEAERNAWRAVDV
jgi:hypothetical protein